MDNQAQYEEEKQLHPIFTMAVLSMFSLGIILSVVFSIVFASFIPLLVGAVALTVAGFKIASVVKKALA